MHRLGGSGQTQDALRRREDGVAAARGCSGEKGQAQRPRLLTQTPPEPSRQPQPGLREADSVNSSGEEPGLRHSGRGHRPLEGTEPGHVPAGAGGQGLRSYSKRAAGAHRTTLFPYGLGTRGASTVREAGVASRGAV